LDSGP
jgi:hypothetical protein